MFRARCEEVLNAYSRGRSMDVIDLHDILDEGCRGERLVLRRRLASLERNRLENDRLIDNLALEIETLRIRLEELEREKGAKPVVEDKATSPCNDEARKKKDDWVQL